MSIDTLAVIGRRPEHRDWFDSDPPYGVAIPSAGYPVAIDGTATIEAYATVDNGTERNTRVGARTGLGKHVHVGHDSIVGADCDIATGTVLAGHVEIGDGARLGINCSVLPYRKIGAGARVGAGSVVTRDVPAGETWAGNPARKLEDAERDSRPYTEREILPQTYQVAPIDGDCGQRMETCKFGDACADCQYTGLRGL